MLKWIRVFEQVIIVVLILLMAVVVVFSTLNLAKEVFARILAPPLLMLDMERLLDLFGLFLLVLIGLELLEIIKAYAQDNVVHVRVVLTVAMIAIARKVIILNVNEMNATSLFGIAGIILALSVALFSLKGNEVSHRSDQGPSQSAQADS